MPTPLSDRPECPQCGMLMMLTRIEPEAPGEELRTFECSLCEHQASVVVKSG